MALVAAGCGVTLAPASVKDLRRSGVDYRPIAEPTPGTRLVAQRRPGEPLPVVARFVAAFREVVSRAGAEAGRARRR